MIKCMTKCGRTNIIIKCDACGVVCAPDEFDGQTDICLAHDWIKENGWRTHKINGKFIQYCPKCEEEYWSQKRKTFFEHLANARMEQEG